MCSTEQSISLLWSENVLSVLCFYKHLAALRPGRLATFLARTLETGL